MQRDSARRDEEIGYGGKRVTGGVDEREDAGEGTRDGCNGDLSGEK